MEHVYDIETYYQLGKFKKLYDVSYKISDFSSEVDTEEYKAFKQSDGLPIGLVSSKKHEKFYPLSVGYYQFYKKSEYFWIIPCEIPNNRIIGFILRSYYNIDYDEKSILKKKYMNVGVRGSFPIFYGWHRFGNYKLGNPIVVCEGIKDSIFLSQYYKYTVATLTNNVSESCLDILSRLTNKVILAYDKDFAGSKGEEKARKNLSKHNIVSVSLKTSYSVKDFGNFFSLGVPEGRISVHMNTLFDAAFKSLGYSA